jgi:hypothetical protein
VANVLLVDDNATFWHALRSIIENKMIGACAQKLRMAWKPSKVSDNTSRCCGSGFSDATNEWP